MPDFLNNIIPGHKIQLLGFGREGQSTYQALRKLFPSQEIFIADKNPLNHQQQKAIEGDNKVFCSTGIHYLNNIFSFDLIIKSPGIPFHVLPDNIDRNMVTSHTELFIRCFRERIIGITGTKGKSTTTSLLYHIMRQEIKDVLLVGNMGRPPFDYLNEITDETRFVFEMSSHQLEQLSIAPAQALLLNIYKEHLDHYGSYEGYQQAKFNITRFQKSTDWFIYNGDDPIITEINQKERFTRNNLVFSSKEVPVNGAYSDGKVIMIIHSGQKRVLFDLTKPHTLVGEHNVMNMMAVACAAQLNGISDEAIAKGFETFVPLEHRMEYVGCFKGIHFYNDSIATIPEASIAAIKALKNIDSIILGGFERGLDYNQLIEFLKKSEIQYIIFMGAAGKRMFESYGEHGGKQLLLASDFEEVVKLAIKNTADGKICLLSPAAASYDWFYNFEERGREFKRLVRKNTLLG